MYESRLLFFNYFCYISKMSNNKWTKKEVADLIRLYPTSRLKELTTLFPNRTLRALKAKAGKLKIYRTIRDCSSKRKSNLANLLNESLESYYWIGLLMADGHLAKQKGKYYTFNVYGVHRDLSTLERHFDIFGKFGKNLYVRKTRATDNSYSIYSSNKDLGKWLEELDFREKSIKSPLKMLNSIPKDLHYLWYRGYSDGDGCFYYNKENYCRQFSITGSYEQTFDFIIDKFEELGIDTYDYKKRISSKGHKHCAVRLSSKSNIEKFGNYIYQDKLEISLQRKLEKFKEICK